MPTGTAQPISERLGKVPDHGVDHLTPMGVIRLIRHAERPKVGEIACSFHAFHAFHSFQIVCAW